MGPGSTRNLNKVLNTILNSFMDLCECDAGSIFTLKKNAEGDDVLAFEAMVTRSKKLHHVPDHLVPLRFKLDDASMVGRTATLRKTFKVAFDHPDGTFSPRVDKILDYVTRTILSAPLVTPRGDLVGVVQLVNKIPHLGRGGKKHPEFDGRDERLLSCVAGQAALAIENSMLLDEQERLLDGFVNACVTAVEARDPVTSGHSTRVCDYTVRLAECVSHAGHGPLKDVHFNDLQIRELRYAAMLHDIGKISVKEEVLNKEKKLKGWELEMIRMRLRLMRTELRAQARILGVDITAQLATVEKAWKAITEANEPTILPSVVGSIIKELTGFSIVAEDGETLSVLTPEEGFKLQIPKGSLTAEERVEIERHVSHTYDILKLVPWSKGLEHVPDIAWRHHEKLDGSGYPSHCAAPQIALQTRMLTISDIYDALTADDRPYKRSMPVEKALDILKMEVDHKKLDGDLFQVFVDARVFEIARRDRKKVA